MMKRVTYAVLCVLAATWANGGQIIREGDTWRFFRGSSAPPSNWATNGFNDSSWEQGASPFGYGDFADNTYLSDMDNCTPCYVSLYTRKTFVISSTAAVTHVSIGVDYDDGFVAYLNGTEVVRANMPGGTILNTTTSAANHECSRTADPSPAAGSNDREYFTINPGLLVEGTNVLAISGHNISTTSSDFLLGVELFTNVTLLRGPFIEWPSGDAATVAWRTDAATDSIVDYGLTTNYEIGSVSVGAPVRDHAVQVPGLPPGTDIYYQVRSGGVVLSSGISFRSRASPTQPFRFAVIGDFGSGTVNMSNVATRVNATNVDFLMTVGDNIYYYGQPGFYDRYWFNIYQPTMRRAATFPTLGNHDGYFSNAHWMADNFYLPTNGPAGMKELVYSYDYGNAHFAVIDTEPFESNDVPAKTSIKNWLTNDLAQATQTWRFVSLHRPPRTSNGVHDDQNAVKNEVGPILEQYHVHFVFQGHNHFYERINPVNGVYYLTSGGGGQSLNAITRKHYSAEAEDATNTFAQVDIAGTKLTVRAWNVSGGQEDFFSYDLEHKFLMDGLLDNPAWARASNSNTYNSVRLYAAIRSNVLYVAAQDAPDGNGVNWFGNDHFIYVNDIITTQKPANWGKSGTIMDWKAFLGDESTGGFVGWFNGNQGIITDHQNYRCISTGLNNNGTNGNGVTEGTINLNALFGAFPTNVALAFAPYATEDGGALLWDYQAPPGNTNGTSINSNEFLWISSRELALDLPVADAGPDVSMEAGMTVSLESSAAAAPSGYALSRQWSQVSGFAGIFGSPTGVVTAFQVTNNVPGPTNLIVRLVVNDTRFESTDTVTVTVSPVLDSDGDGLSDVEEQTGENNPLTSIDPGGQISDPFQADTDGDGMNDGSEAIAGTSANDDLDYLKVSDEARVSSTNLVIRWPSASNRAYNVNVVTNLIGGVPVVLFTNLSATPPLNVQTVPVEQANQRYIYIEIDQ